MDEKPRQPTEKAEEAIDRADQAELSDEDLDQVAGGKVLASGLKVVTRTTNAEVVRVKILKS